MNTLAWVWAGLAHRPLPNLLHGLLMAFATGLIGLMILADHQLRERAARDAGAIDMVIGAPGSPLQLVLSAVYHLDAPTGNVPLREVARWQQHPLVAEAVPLALGDSARGYRIVGTSPGYLDLYGARLAQGRLWERPMEAVIGAEVARRDFALGSRIIGAHGFADGGHLHEDTPYRVVGVLAPSGTVLDRLILTSVESVWKVHGHDHDHDHDHEHDHGHGHDQGHDHDHGHHDHGHEREHDHPHHDHGHGHHHEHGHDHDHAPTHGHGKGHEHPRGHGHDPDHGHGHDQGPPAPAPDRPAEGRPPAKAESAQASPDEAITALLVRFRSPLGAALLPREINTEGRLMAATPAQEILRLRVLADVPLKALQGVAAALVALAALAMLAALNSALESRRYDLAILRALGASRWHGVRLLWAEATVLAVLGALAGLLLAHLGIESIGRALPGRPFTGLAFVPAEAAVLGLAVLVALLAVLLPAVRAFRVDVAGILSRP